MIPPCPIIDPETAALYKEVDAITKQVVYERRRAAIRDGASSYSVYPDLGWLGSSAAVRRGTTTVGHFHRSLLPLEGEAKALAARRAPWVETMKRVAKYSAPVGLSLKEQAAADETAENTAVFLGRATVFLEILGRWVVSRQNTTYRHSASPTVLARHVAAIYRSLCPHPVEYKEAAMFYTPSSYGSESVPEPRLPPPPRTPAEISASVWYARMAAEHDPHGWGNGPPATPSTDLQTALLRRSALAAMVAP